jgi:hypothetical protein
VWGRRITSAEDPLRQLISFCCCFLSFFGCWPHSRDVLINKRETDTPTSIFINRFVFDLWQRWVLGYFRVFGFIQPARHLMAFLSLSLHASLWNESTNAGGSCNEPSRERYGMLSSWCPFASFFLLACGRGWPARDSLGRKDFFNFLCVFLFFCTNDETRETRTYSTESERQPKSRTTGYCARSIGRDLLFFFIRGPDVARNLAHTVIILSSFFHTHTQCCLALQQERERGGNGINEKMLSFRLAIFIYLWRTYNF